MRKANVYFRNALAGTLVEDENGYAFAYDDHYLASAEAEPISLTLPLSSLPYRSNVLFPFFDGLIPEGWLLDITVKNWKIDPNSPAYDLLNVHLILDDPEDLALPLDGKKSNLNGQNFIHAMAASGLDDKVIQTIFGKLKKAASSWFDFIDISFLTDDLKEKYKAEITQKLSKL